MSGRGLVPFLDELKDGSLNVGARNPETDYTGPVANVYIEREWLYVNTDDYEGCAMLNVEALPMLIKALEQLRDTQAPKP